MPVTVVPALPEKNLKVQLDKLPGSMIFQETKQRQSTPQKRGNMSLKMKMYSVKDAKAEFFHEPMYAHTHGEAERNLKNAVNADPEKSQIAKFPQDYDLWYVGEFDKTTGKIEPVVPQHLCNADQLRNATH